MTNPTISHDLKTIFVHIPKTAGVSVSRMIESYRVKNRFSEWKIKHFNDKGDRVYHMTFQMIKDRYYHVGFFDNYFKFSIVRNPYDRFISEWLWHKQLTGWCKDGIDYFIDHIKDMPIMYAIDHIKPQYDFLYDKDGTMLADYVGRFEELYDSWQFIVLEIFKRSGHLLPETLVKTHRTKKNKKYYEYYTPKAKQFVLNKYRIDFETFGYDKKLKG